MSSKKVLLVSHDVGGANNIAYLVRDFENQFNFDAYVDGPAKQVFSDICPNINRLETLPLIDSYNCVLTGTGWQSDIEIKALDLAKRHGVRTVSYLDHWVNFTERFDHSELGKVFPDELWVADRVALSIAQPLFHDVVSRIRIVRNRYLHLLKSLHRVTRCQKKYDLLCLEPIRLAISYQSVYKRLLSKIGAYPIRIRLHPSGADCGLPILLKLLEERNVPYEFSHSSLAEDFSQSNNVFGFQSSVLVYALELGISVYSFYPAERMEPILPHDGIRYL